MKIFFLLSAISFQFSLFAQNGSDIILFDVLVKPTGIILSNPVNITAHKGYDNQPFFYKKDIYYSSQTDSGQMDIKKYNYQTKFTSVITNTADNEFSPTVTPDKKFISCILQRKNGKQDLVKYPINKGGPVIIIDNLKVGYHTWADNNSLVLFVLEDTNINALHYYNIVTKEDSRITTDIGRSLQQIPGKHAISFIQKSGGIPLIKQYDIQTKKIRVILPALPNAEYLAWTKAGTIVMSDGKEIYFNKAGKYPGWEKIKMPVGTQLKNITRLALNEQNNKLAVVVAE